jgi:ubiquitin carboxyl-terminal hydrolase 4/11
VRDFNLTFTTLTVPVRYGTPNHPLPRRVIERGITKQTSIEIRPPKLHLQRLSSSTSEESPRHIVISAGETISALNSKLAAAFPPKNPSSTYRIWKINPPTIYDDTGDVTSEELAACDGKLMGDSDKTLEEEGIQSDDWFIIEYQHDGIWLVDEDDQPMTGPPATAPGKALTPLFNSQEGFFNKFSEFGTAKTTDPGAGTSIKLKPTKSTSIVPAKEKPIQPGTLGLGNMCATV